MIEPASRPDISKITEYLYISAWPRGEHVDEIVNLNVRLILSMHWRRPSETLGRPPVRLLWLPTVDTPLTPIPIRTLHKGVEAALPVIRDGGSVLVHCVGGRHRSVAMASCVLIARGLTAEDAMALIKEKRLVADPYAWYIQWRIRKFERDWIRREQDTGASAR
jgi:protein-tyrosine phosphatase